MKYIIMCGGDYHTDKPKQLFEINGEPIVKRTIRLLRENGIEDIAISSNDERFEKLGVPCLRNGFNTFGNGGYWIDGFYPTKEPVCYLFGDVFFSPEAIKTIVETETKDIEFFASAPPFAKEYIKQWAEPFAFKVVAVDFFRMCIDTTRKLAIAGRFNRDPIAWELWQVINLTPLNEIDYTNYVAINDYTTDFDNERELELFKEKKWEEKA